mmetsp:Transcript_30144/g.73369  ORF Transcript_30144/g.73369 Transcript_30144/m.73369 type:complete len:263 (+) Transcript_30144:837-1625(+)
MGNVPSKLHALELDLIHSSVGNPECLLKGGSSSGNCENTAAAGDELAIVELGPSMEDNSPVLDILNPRDFPPLGILLGVALACGDDGCGVLVLELNVDLVEGSVAAGNHDLIKVGVEQREKHLRLWVSEAAVEFERLWALFWVKHHASIEDANKLAALGAHSINRSLENVLQDKLPEVLCKDWGWGVSTHTAGVWSLVAFEDALVILGSRHEHNGGAVGEGKAGGLGPAEKLFNDNFCSRVTEFFVDHDTLEILKSLLSCLR